jgi:hypothetical protein
MITAASIAATVGPLVIAGAIILALPSTTQAPPMIKDNNEDPSGTATIHYWESGAIDPDLQAPHYAITVTFQGVSTTSELTISDNNTAVVVTSTQVPKPKPNMSVPVPIPNAQTAQGLQESLNRQPVGQYNKNTNSCVTHVLDILRAGGYPIRGPNSILTATREVFRPLEIPIR